MEDVVVQRTTMRSTTQNPTPKKTGGLTIQGDNINIGTIIVNSPNAQVDKSTRIVQTQQNNQSHTPPSASTSNSKYFKYPYPEHNSSQPEVEQKPYHTERDFFRGMDDVFLKLIPSLIMMR